MATITATRTVLTRGAYEKLLAGLVYIEEQRNNLLEEYFPEPTPQRRLITMLLDEYIPQVEQLTKDITVAETSDNSIPFVIMGSVVQLEDLETNQSTQFRITPPLENTEIDDASLLSPVGMSLLLKRVGESVIINTPGNILRYRIKSITLPFP